MRKFKDYSELEKTKANEKADQMTKLCGDVYRDRCRIALWLPDEITPRLLKIVDRLKVAQLHIDCFIAAKTPSSYVVSSLLPVLNPNYTVMSIDDVVNCTDYSDTYCLLDPPLDFLIAA